MLTVLNKVSMLIMVTRKEVRYNYNFQEIIGTTLFNKGSNNTIMFVVCWNLLNKASKGHSLTYLIYEALFVV